MTHTAHVVDLTPPAISLRTPLDGAVYLLDEAVAADYDCADDPGGSGLASCAGDVADGEPVDTAAVGDHTFTVTAADLGGGTASASGHYRVLYDFRGFRRPTEDPPAVNRARAGLVLAVRFSLERLPRPRRAGGGLAAGGRGGVRRRRGARRRRARTACGRPAAGALEPPGALVSAPVEDASLVGGGLPPVPPRPRRRHRAPGRVPLQRLVTTARVSGR